MCQAAIIGADDVAALLPRDRRDELGEGVRKEPARPFLVEPIEFGSPEKKDAAQDQRVCAVWLRLRISQRQRRPPGTADELPARDAEMASQPLHIFDQVPSG